MPHSRRPPFTLLSLALVAASIPGLPAAAAEQPVIEEVIIDIGGNEPAGGSNEIVIEGLSQPDVAGPGELIIEDSGPAAPAPTIEARAAVSTDRDPDSRDVEIRIDDVRAEYGHFTHSNAEADSTLYGKISGFANWQPAPQWEFQVAGRVDGYDQDQRNAFTEVTADYGDSFVRYRGDNFRLTAGTQTVVWGRLDEIPLSDRVSTADLTRFVLDNLEDRRRSNPMLRAETFVASGKLDLVWLFDFRPAELPDQDSVWYPINRESGRILGIDPAIIPPAAVQNATIIEDAPSGDGGFGARYTRTHSLADFGVTVARTRQSTPYFRSAGAGRFQAEYPRSWAYGADAAIDAGGATWRVELLYSSDNPVTRTDLSYTTTPGIAWGGGVEFHPGDGDTRVNLQLVGMNLFDAPAIIDREEIYSINGEIETPFDRARWRTRLDFYVGIGDKDIYLNPEVAFLAWEPHELYLALHYFAGDPDTLGGFHEDHSSINLGWRASF